MRESHSEVSARLRESESALAEMGERLSRATLENERLKEESRSSRVDFGAWQEDSAVSECQLCAKEFGLARRKVCTEIGCYILSSSLAAPINRETRGCLACLPVYSECPYDQKWDIRNRGSLMNQLLAENSRNLGTASRLSLLVDKMAR